jgi:hypothetical protein
VTTGDVRVFTSTTLGSGVPAPSAASITFTEHLTDVLDVADHTSLAGGTARASLRWAFRTATLTANMIAKANVQFSFPFQPTQYVLVNMMRPQNEAITASGYYISLALAGGGSPNNQANDVIMVWAAGT